MVPCVGFRELVLCKEKLEMDECKRLDEVANWYSSRVGFDSRLIEYGFRTLSPFFRGRNCLELGPADGQMTRLLVEVFDNVTAVDGAQRYCEILQQRVASPKLKVVCSLFEEFEPAEKFDTAIMTHVLEHVADPVQLFHRVSGWIRATGVIIVLVPNANSIHRLVAVKMGLLKHPWQLNERDRRLGHRRVYTLVELKAHIAAAGLKLLATGGNFFKPLTNRQIEEWWTEEMMDGFYELGKDFPEYAAEIYAVCQLPRS